MLFKLIRCRVPAPQRIAFDEGQRLWSALRDVPGFRGQLGGWCTREPETAWIVGLWRDRAAYDHFMRMVHDDIVAGGSQPRSYEAIEVTLLDRLMTMPGETADLASALATGTATLLRLALCHVPTERRAHFEAAQRDVWRPAMGSAPGMIGGDFSAEPEGAYLVATSWTTAEAHDDYAARHVSTLRARASADADLSSLRGGRVALEPAWTVLPTHGREEARGRDDTP